MKSPLTYLSATLSVSILLTGCLDQEESAFDKRVQEENKMIEDYLDSNQIEAERLSSGIFFEELKKNDSGSAVDDEDIVAIHYSLRTLDGKPLDSLTADAAPIRFFHAQNAPNAFFPRGVNIGTGYMREGEKYRFYIPSYHAFDTYSFGQLLPKEAILIADVEIQKLEDEDDIKEMNRDSIQSYIQAHELSNVEEPSSGLFFQTLEEGDGDAPKSGNRVKVSYKGYYLDGEVFDESENNKPIEFTIGTNSVIPGFERGIREMKEGEKARIFIPSDLGFEGGVQVIPKAIRKDFLEEYDIRNWRPFEPVIFDVELTDIQ